MVQYTLRISTCSSVPRTAATGTLDWILQQLFFTFLPIPLFLPVWSDLYLECEQSLVWQASRAREHCERQKLNRTVKLLYYITYCMNNFHKWKENRGNIIHSLSQKQNRGRSNGYDVSAYVHASLIVYTFPFRSRSILYLTCCVIWNAIMSFPLILHRKHDDDERNHPLLNKATLSFGNKTWMDVGKFLLSLISLYPCVGRVGSDTVADSYIQQNTIRPFLMDLETDLQLNNI